MLKVFINAQKSSKKSDKTSHFDRKKGKKSERNLKKPSFDRKKFKNFWAEKFLNRKTRKWRSNFRQKISWFCYLCRELIQMESKLLSEFEFDESKPRPSWLCRQPIRRRKNFKFCSQKRNSQKRQSLSLIPVQIWRARSAFTVKSRRRSTDRLWKNRQKFPRKKWHEDFGRKFCENSCEFCAKNKL